MKGFGQKLKVVSEKLLEIIKKYKVVVIALAVIVALVIVFMMLPTNVLKRASNKTAKLKNYHMTTSFTMGVESQGVELEVPVRQENFYNSKSKASRLEIAVNYFGVDITTDGYVDYKNKMKTYIQGSNRDTWAVEEVDGVVDSKIVSSFVKAASKSKKVSSDEKDIIHYQITIPKDKVMDLVMNSIGTMQEKSTLTVDREDYEITKDITVDIYVNKKKKYVEKMTTDLTEAIVASAPEMSTLNVKIFTLEFSFDQLDQVEEIIIPEDVIANAEDKKIVTTREDIEEYMQTIYYRYMLEEKKPSKVTETDLDISGITPEKVDVTLNKEGKVESGEIVLNGMTATIEDGEIKDLK